MKDNNNKKPISQYAKYSSLTFQMLGAIGMFFILGRFIDKKYNHNDVQIYTAILSFVGLFFAFYLLYKTIKAKK